MIQSLALRFLTIGLSTLVLMFPTLSHAAMDEPGHVVTVMQFSAKNPASVAALKERMLAMRDFQRQQPGYVENALFENRNPQTTPQYVGVARWKTLKEWETLWQNDTFQKLVRAINEVGETKPGVFTAVK